MVGFFTEPNRGLIVFSYLNCYMSGFWYLSFLSVEGERQIVCDTRGNRHESERCTDVLQLCSVLTRVTSINLEVD